MAQKNKSLFFVGYDSYIESSSASPILLEDLDGKDDTPDQVLAFDACAGIRSQLQERDSRARKLKSASAGEDLNLDDLDMIPLTTKFDVQMEMGSPMAMPPDTPPPIKPLTAKDLAYSSLAHLPSYFFEQTHLHIERKCLLDMCKLRQNYLTISKQNALACSHLHAKPLEKHLRRVKDGTPETPHLLDVNEDNNPTFSSDSNYIIQLCNGHVDVPTFIEFKRNFEQCLRIIQDRNLSIFSEKRLQYLLNKFPVFQYLKSKEEMRQSKNVPHKDFYNCRKIDLNLLLSGCFSQWQLTEFIWSKLEKEPNKIIYQTSNGRHITLIQLFKVDFEEANIFSSGLKIIDDSFLEWYKVIYLAKHHLINSESETNIDSRDKQFRHYLIAKTFLEFDNYINGEYLAELLQKFLIKPLETSKYQLCQLSVDFQSYFHDGNSDVDNWWMVFANWLNHYGLYSNSIRWNVRISRIYPELYHTGKIKNFQDFLDLIFKPLFNAKSYLHKSLGPVLSRFLSRVASFDLCIQDSDDYVWKQFTNVELSTRKLGIQRR